MLRRTRDTLIWLLAAAVGTLAAARLPATCQGQEASVVHFGFDEGQGDRVRDGVSGSSERIIGQAVWEKGVHGNALRMNGIDTTIVASKPSGLDMAKGFTVQAWIQTAAMGRQFIAQQYDGDGWSMEIRDGAVITRLAKDGKGPSVQSEKLYADGQWHQVTAVWDGRVLHQYIDGRSVGHATTDGSIRFFTDAKLCIGRYGVGEKFYGFRGLIDEVRIDNRAMTPAEVRASFVQVMPSPAEVPAIQREKRLLAERIRDMRFVSDAIGGDAAGAMASRLADLDRRVQAVNPATWEPAEEEARLESVKNDVAPLRVELAGLHTRAIAGRASKPVVWVSNPLADIFQDALLPERLPKKEIEIEACRGEYEPAQIAVSSFDYKGPVRATVGPLVHSEGKGSLSATTVRYVGYVSATGNTQDEYLVDRVLRKAPAKYPDPLLEADQVELASRQTQPIWITVKVPRTAAAGTYRGTVEIETGAGKETVPLTLRVWPIDLPEKPIFWLGSWAGLDCLVKEKQLPIDRYDASYFELLKAALRNRREHRCCVYSDLPLWSVYNTVKVSWHSGGYAFDFSEWDKFLSVIDEAYDGHFRVADVSGLDASVRVANPDGSANQAKSFPSPSMDDPAFREYLACFLRAMQDHLKQMGWLEKVYFKVQDEPDAAALVRVRRLSAFIQQTAPELRQNETVEPDAVSVLDDVDLAIVGWNGLTNAPPDFLTPELRKGREIWTYNNYTSMVDMPLIHTRINGLANYLGGFAGYSHWAWAFAWPRCQGRSPWQDAYYPPFGPGEGFLIYVDRDGRRILDSRRWEMFREASEDYDLLTLLAAAGGDPKTVCRQLIRSMRGEYETDAEKFYRVRHRLLCELADAQKRGATADR